MAPKTASKPAAKATAPAAKAAAAPKAGAKGGAAAPAKAAPKQAAAPKQQRASDGSAIYIRGLNPTLRAADVYDFFGTYGTIKEVRVRTGRYTLVWFENPAAAKKAQEVNGKNVRGAKVSVEAGRAASRPAKEDTATSVWLGKLPGGTNKKQLIELVKGFGKIHKIRLSERKHQAFIYYEDNAVAKKAVAGLTGKKLRNAEIEARLSIRSNALDKKKLGKRPKPVAAKKTAVLPKAAGKATKPAAPAAKSAAAPATTTKTAAPAAKAAAAPAAKPAAKAAAAPAAKPATKAAPKKK